jgi:hypothetical protein
MCIITGPRIDLETGLIDRMKRLFYDKGLIFLSYVRVMVHVALTFTNNLGHPIQGGVGSEPKT